MREKQINYIEEYLPKSKWISGIEELKAGRSPQYIVGNVNFYGYIFNVDERVLIPRFETELLVEKTILFLKKNFKKQIKILDIGTGSGCIAIALKKETDNIVYASDVSLDALCLAKENAIKNNADIVFVESDIFSNINDKFDVIISNPPYISHEELIEDIVKNNEPHIALYADDDGLFFYNKILKECKNYLNNKFLIAFEIGHKQGDAVRDIVYNYFGDEVEVVVEKDYCDRDRFVFIYKK